MSADPHPPPVGSLHDHRYSSFLFVVLSLGRALRIDLWNDTFTTCYLPPGSLRTWRTVAR